MKRCALLVAVLVGFASAVFAQVNMPDPKQISGVPLPAPDAANGSVSVRVIRGSFANNLAGVDVVFNVDGKTTTRRTDQNGRAELAGLRPGARVRASTIVAGERLETQETAVAAAGGLRFVLAATDPATVERQAEDKTLAAGPAVKGAIVVGPESRIVAEFAQDKLTLYYMLHLVNTARTPVDLGGPFILELPQGARGAGLMDGTTPTATVNGPRVTVLGPFVPGVTDVNVAFELPYGGAEARFDQRWPAPVQQLSILMVKTGEMNITSPQFTTSRSAEQQGQSVVMAAVETLGAEQPLSLEITGLPHHAAWPRNFALAAAGVILLMGLWAAFGPTPSRQGAAV